MTKTPTQRAASAGSDVLACATAPAWTAAVRADFDRFLSDHAACERKASAMAVTMICHYPDRRRLVNAMADLAVEEMVHYREVLRLLDARGVTPAADEKDPYVNQLRALARSGQPQAYLQDRLLIAGLIEARGAERFGLLADALRDDSLSHFYTRLAQSEARHHALFFDLADRYFDRADNLARRSELAAAEARIVTRLPARAALH